MQRLLCVFGIHQFKVIAVNHYWDTSWGKVASTRVVYKCACCNKIKTTALYGAGFLDLEEVQ